MALKDDTISSEGNRSIYTYCTISNRFLRVVDTNSMAEYRMMSA